MPKYSLGWTPDLPDHRDFVYSAPLAVLKALPPKIDLRPLMPPVYDQSLIGCHDEKTEVLTDLGWKNWSTITGNELLGTMNQEDGVLEFQIPTELHQYEYDGPLHYADHRSLDFALTPTHRMYVRPWNQRNRTLEIDYSFVTMDKIGWYTGLPNTVTGHRGIGLKSLIIGNRVWDGDDLLALMALIISDGWVGGTEHNWNCVGFCCFREDRGPMVRELAAKLGLPEIPGRPGVWKWTDAALAAWFRTNAYTSQQLTSPFKRIPDIVKTATADQISRFLNYYGDQHIGNGHRHFYTSSHQLADDLQELLLRVGKRASFYERKPRNVQMADGRKIDAENCSSDITIIERSMDNLSIERRKNIKLQTYKGMVYCATVPNSLLVTRRNGSILISGNSCTSNAIGAAIQYERLKYNSSPDFVPSRLFIYYNERAMERTIPLDAGAMIRDGIKSVSSHGVCPESDWPYHATPADPDTNLFPAKSPPVTKPPAKAYLNAKQYTAISYFRIQQNLNQLKGCLAAGYPFVFGFVVYTNLYTPAGDPVVHLTLPSGTDSALGGHAVMAVGYDDAKAEFIIRNSWGDKVQDHGNFYMPYSYLTDNNLADDIWTIRKMTA